MTGIEGKVKRTSAFGTKVKNVKSINNSPKAKPKDFTNKMSEMFLI
jgi:hypothetical protein